MTIKEFFSFKKNTYFWGNILAMVVVVFAVGFGVLKAIDNYTRHGEAIVVPDVKGMNISDAEMAFERSGLQCVISDSTYIKEETPGCVLEYRPACGQKVKKGRLIYLTINTKSTPLLMVPDVADNSSLRQAEARLLAAGFKLTPNDTIPGEKDWVYGVKYNERLLTTGEKVPMGSTLTIMVGDGGLLEVLNDSTQTEQGKEGEAVNSTATADDSWF